jgi:uncharacterized protein (TIGR00725 family)
MTVAPADAPYIAVIGASTASESEESTAERVGTELAHAGAVVICGGGPGVMAAASRGASGAGGTVIGILPGNDRSRANAFVSIALATGLGELRNGLIVRACDAAVAVGGGYGTLSEIGLALAQGVPVVGLGTWQIDGIEQRDDPVGAVARVLELAGARRRPVQART